MRWNTYHARGIVLKKTKFSEKDLIVTFLLDDGSLVQAIARGARKPGGTLSARMELCNNLKLLCARGRNLDIVKEASVIDPAHCLHELHQIHCALPLAELTRKIVHTGLEQPRLYDLIAATFSLLSSCNDIQAYKISTACFWKIVSQIGYCPNYDSCSECGRLIDIEDPKASFSFSTKSGGLICSSCNQNSPYTIARDTIRWSRVLIFSTYKEILSYTIAPQTLHDLNVLILEWIEYHLNCSLRSFSYYLLNAHDE